MVWLVGKKSPRLFKKSEIGGQFGRGEYGHDTGGQCYVESNGYIYSGQFDASGYPKGKGQLRIGPKLVYHGSVSHGEFDGKGKCWYENGNCYDGEFCMGKRKGRGRMAYLNGDVYEGQWDNLPDGTGVMAFICGDRYEGQWKKGLRHGFGVFEQEGVGKYEGMWKFGVKHGKGKFCYINGDVYDGLWSQGKPHGPGRCWYQESGDRYEGMWTYGKQSGIGTLRKANGCVWVGKWENGTLYDLIHYVDKDKRIYKALSDDEIQLSTKTITEMPDKDITQGDGEEMDPSDCNPPEIPYAIPLKDEVQKNVEDVAQEEEEEEEKKDEPGDLNDTNNDDDDQENRKNISNHHQITIMRKEQELEREKRFKKSYSLGHFDSILGVRWG